MVQLGLSHYIYVLFVIFIIIIMSLKKDVVLPCILGIGIMGYLAAHNLISAVQIIFKAILISAGEFLEIVIIIALVNAMSEALKDTGADEVMIGSIKKFMRSKTASYFISGLTMLLVSWFIWPTPAYGFIGAIILPSALKSGLSRLSTASVLTLFGGGAALSSDFFIQGAPSITAKAAGIKDPFALIDASIILWLTMSIFAVLSAFIMMKRSTQESNIKGVEIENREEKTVLPGIRVIAFIVPVLFLIDIVLMYIYKIKGGDATALIGGTAVIISIITIIYKYGAGSSLSKITALLRDSAVFSMKVFAPVIIIGAFFFLGNKTTGNEILGDNAGGYLADIAVYVSHKIPLSKFTIILMQAAISVILGIGGSGFSGLPLIGALAEAFSMSFPISRTGLAALGQIITIWVGGGTIIPWAMAPAAAVCEVEPFDIAKANFIPFLIGTAAAIIIAIIIL